MATINGTAGNDKITGTLEADDLWGLGGNDEISGGAGDDRIIGDNGFSAIGDGDDWLSGGLGNDLIFGGGGADTIFGDQDRDVLYGGTGSDTIDGGDGDDHLEASGDFPDLDRDTLLGGSGNDYLVFGYGDTVDGGTGLDSAALEFAGTSPAGVNVDLRTLTSGGTVSIGGGTLSGIEYIRRLALTDFDDVVIAGAVDGVNHLWILGHGGNDDLTGSAGVDLIWGGLGNDILRGGIGADLSDPAVKDQLRGEEGDDTIYTGVDGALVYGGSGHDLVQGGAGSDTIYGDGDSTYPSDDDGNDSLYGGGGDDRILGGGGNDSLDGGLGNDWLTGGSGQDTISGGDGDDIIDASGYDYYALADVDHDTLLGGAGNDRIVSGYGDTVDGGSGTDTLSLNFFGSSEVGVTVDLRTLTAGGTVTIGGGVLSGIEYVGGLILTDLNDNVIAGAVQGPGGIFMSGLGGNDDLTGTTGVDQIYGGEGDDVLRGGVGRNPANPPGIDQLYGEAGNDTIYIGPDGAWAIGGVGNDTVYGGDGKDEISGNDGDDVLHGGSGDDRIEAGFGNDTVNGGDGADSINADYGNDLVDGGAGDDRLLGWGGTDTLRGGSGNDTLFGSLGIGGDDVYNTADADVLDGGDGEDFLNGEGGNDSLYGGNDDDTLIGEAGNDLLDGGAGFDIASYLYIWPLISQFPVNVSLAIAGPQNTGLGFDTLVNIEGLEGGFGNDILTGNQGDNYLNGSGGNDQLFGGGGSDVLTGDYGSDTLTGGAGNDIFRDEVLGLNRDTITDFGFGDRIEITDAELAAFAYRMSGNTLFYSGGSLTLSAPLAGNLIASATINGGVQLQLQPLDTTRKLDDDFNGDGRSDMLWRRDDGLFTDWLGKESGGFFYNDAKAGFQVPTSWQIAGTGDFNGDDRADILWRRDDGALTDWLGNADGSFLFNDAYAWQEIPLNWSVIGTGDFNGDGRSDVMWQRDDGYVTNWLGEVTGGFTYNDDAAGTVVPLDWTMAGTGDFNGDGRTDVAWRRDDGAFTNWLAEEDGGFVSNDAYAWRDVPTNWHIAGTGDFDGDGRSDILWRSDDGAFTSWNGQADGGFVYNDVYARQDIPVNWAIIGTGDYNGDFRDDIMWRNEDTGYVTNWLGQMNGAFIYNDAHAGALIPLGWQPHPDQMMV